MHAQKRGSQLTYSRERSATAKQNRGLLLQQNEESANNNANQQQIFEYTEHDSGSMKPKGGGHQDSNSKSNKLQYRMNTLSQTNLNHMRISNSKQNRNTTFGGGS